MGRLQSEAESLEEAGLHNETENNQIDDSDEDEFEIAKEKSGYCKPSLLLILVLLAIALFATRSDSTNSSFTPIPSTYLSTLFTQRPSSLLQQWLDPRQPYLSIFIPAQTFPPPTCPTVWSPKCGVSNLKTQGAMLRELQTWLLANLRGSEKILVVWREDLAVAILLMSKRMQKDRQFMDSPDAEIMVIVATKDVKSQQFQALRLTLAKQDTLSFVSFAETDQWILPENMAQYELVIGPGSLFHANLIESNLREQDPLDPTVQEEVGGAVFDAIPKTRLVLLYNGSPNEEEMAQFAMVKSEVIKLVLNQPSGFMEERVKTSSQLEFGSGIGLLLINPILSTPIQVHTSRISKESEEPDLPEKQPPIFAQQPAPSSNKQQANSDIQIQVKWKAELMIVATIKRLEGARMTQILNCSEPDNPDYVNYGNFMRTHLQRIEIEREDQIIGDELIDITHLAKFLVDYFLTAGPSNVFCPSDSPLLVNLISLTNPEGNMFLLDSFRNAKLLQRGLTHNGLSGHLHWVHSKDFDLITLLKVEQIRLVAVDPHFLNDWRMLLQLALENQVQLLMKKQETIEQIRLVEDMAFQGGLHIYVIYPREDRQFDLGCLRDYEFQLFVNDVKYPHNTFFLLSRQELAAESVDPSADFSPQHRLVTINPYPCASPPYLRSKKQPEKEHILMKSRYDFVVPVNPTSEKLFKQQGAQEIGLLQLIRSSLIQTDRVLLYADASSNPLLSLILMRIVGERGKLSITAMSKKQTDNLQQSLQYNDMGQVYQATEVSASDPKQIKKLFLELQPTVVITKPDLLQRDEELLRLLPAGSMVLFKYASQDYFFEGYLTWLSQQHKLHEIYYDPRSDKTNLCNDFRLRSLTAANIAKHELGWFVLQP